MSNRSLRILLMLGISLAITLTVLIPKELLKEAQPNTDQSRPGENKPTSSKGGHKPQSAVVQSYEWGAAGVTISYPGSWTLGEVETNSDFARLKLFSTSRFRSTDGYFCLEMVLNPAATYVYPLRRGGMISRSTANDFSIYAASLQVGSKQQARAWLTNDQNLSTIDLLDGSRFFAQISYSCIQGDLDNSTLTYEEQISSPDYEAALQILRTLRFHPR